MAYMKKTFPASARIFLRRRHLHREPAARARNRQKARPARLHLELQQPREPGLRHHQNAFKDNGLRLFLVGYESGNDDTLTRIKKGVTTEEMRRFTKACHQAGVVIHGTFILGLPVETKETIEQTIDFAKELDVFCLQVSLAAPYPGTELYEQAKHNGWFAKKDKTDLVERRPPAKHAGISRA